MKNTLSLVKQILYSVFVLLICVAVVEFFASFVSSKFSVFWENPLMIQYPITKFDEKKTNASFNFNNSSQRSVRYVPDKNRWYRLDSEPAIPKNKKLVLNFGDSSTWGWGLYDRNYTYSIVLNKMLPKDVVSVNLGVPGYSSLQGLRYVEEMMHKYSNQIIAITLYFGNNDSVENGLPDEKKMQNIKQYGVLIKIRQWFEKKSAFFRVMRGAVSKITHRNNAFPRVMPEEFRRNLEHIISLAQEKDIPVVIIMPIINWHWQPAHLTESRSLKNETGNQWVLSELNYADRLYRDGIRLLYQYNDDCEVFFQAAVDHDWILPRIKTDWRHQIDILKNHAMKNVFFVDIPDYLAGTVDSPTFVDYCHPDMTVHEKIAKQIFEDLKGQLR